MCEQICLQRTDREDEEPEEKENRQQNQNQITKHQKQSMNFRVFVVEIDRHSPCLGDNR